MDSYDNHSIGEILAGIAALFDRLFESVQSLPSADDQLAVLESMVTVSGRAQAAVLDLVGKAVTSEAAEIGQGISLRTWITERCRYTGTQAGSLIHQAKLRGRFPQVADAARRGELNPHQVSAIVNALNHLPDELSTAEVAAGAATLVGYAAQFDSDGLTALAKHLVEVVAPEAADELDAKALEREAKVAARNRHLAFSHDGHGSVFIRGQLPTLTAEPLLKIIEAYSEDQRRKAIDRLDPLAETLTPAMRRADALVALINAHSQQQLAPSVGGDRPRIVVTITWDQLLTDCTKAKLIDGTGDLTAGQLRQLACDADILPAVLGGNSEALDVAREKRLVTPPIRLALTLRDQGCVFPGCDTPAIACHAHHITPWWAGGTTALGNLVLVCPHHHGIVEPARLPNADRWTIRINDHGIPEVVPPKRVDPSRTPRLHQRFKHPRIE